MVFYINTSLIVNKKSESTSLQKDILLVRNAGKWLQVNVLWFYQRTGVWNRYNEPL